ncbi:hypothetical protein IFM89_011847 [Coptis chinensis]|uniref:Uncharacterized protein n=1 Tax=Coptis chinensis TaxID=261450 RepID=A0A835I1G5_9MAGN|nr:hypothetical protein IFM89_011847 [Coptis chinensis]
MQGIQNQRDPPSTTYTLVEKELTMTPAPFIRFQAQPPTWKLSPWNGGSTLYDSYELRAVTQQLNRTIQGSQTMYSPCPNHVKYIYPFRGYLDRLYKENAKTPKQVTRSKADGSIIEDDKSTSNTKRNFMPRWWRRFKLTFRSKKTSCACIQSQTTMTTTSNSNPCTNRK